MPLKYNIASILMIAAFTAGAAPEIVSPVDYSTVSTMSDTLKAFKNTSTMVTASTYGSGTKDNATRTGYQTIYREHSLPITLSWSGSTGNATVTVKRAKDNAVVFTSVTNGTSVLFYDAEIGRNYSWTVTDAGGTATGHFFTELNAPRIIQYAHGSYVENARDLGGWAAMNGKVVKQGMLYRSRQFEWCAISEPGDSLCIPYWRDVIGIKLDDDLRVYDEDSGIRG